MADDDLIARGRRIVESGKYATPRGKYLGRIEHWGLEIPPDEPPGPTETPDPPPEPDPGSAAAANGAAPTTWEPVDLGPYLRGEIERPEPCLGITRSPDGVKLVYPGLEHAVVGETECGKSWLTTACAAAELTAGNHVVYAHYEESDPASTVERLQLLGVAQSVILAKLRFVGPERPVRAEWLAPLLIPTPTLVVHDGVNEGMAMHKAEQDTDGWSSFRRRLIVPCLKVGAAVVSCDHVPMSRDGTRRDAYGTVHKGNTLDGARIALENVQPFGRRMRGVSHVFVTKDRPGQLRNHGKPTKTPGKTYMGTLVVDDSQSHGPDFSVRFYAPKADEQVPESCPGDADRETVFAAIAETPEHAVASKRALRAQLRLAGAGLRNTRIDECVDELVACGRLREVPGKRGACRYEAVLTGSRTDSDSGGCATGSGSGSPIGGEPGTGHHSTGSEPVGTGGNRSDSEADE